MQLTGTLYLHVTLFPELDVGKEKPKTNQKSISQRPLQVTMEMTIVFGS